MIEIYKSNPKSCIYYGNCQDVIDIWLKSYAGKVDLIYIDPPNFKGNSYKHIQKIGINQGRITHTEAIDTSSNKKEYYDILYAVIKKCKILLKDTGNIFVHMNSKTSCDMRMMLDDVFGNSNLVNEIIWPYEQGGNSSHHFRNCHDTILFYRKSSRGYFDPKSASKMRGSKRRNHMKKNTTSDGRVYYSIIVSGKEYKYYEDDLIHMSDVWDDIILQQDNDRNHFDGQKPKKLLERIIFSASPENALVCDPFAGSGTTGIIAAESGRSFLLCDNSFFAINLSKTNIAQLNIPFEVIWDDINIYNNMPEVNFTKNFTDKHKSVHLDDYKITSGKKYYSNTLLPTEDTLVDSWSVGRVVDDKFYVDDFDTRTQKKPTLGRFLHIKHGKGKCCALTCDVFGNQVLHEL